MKNVFSIKCNNLRNILTIKKPNGQEKSIIIAFTINEQRGKLFFSTLKKSRDNTQKGSTKKHT